MPLDRSIHWLKPVRNLFRVKASGEVEVPGAVIRAFVALLAVLIGIPALLLKKARIFTVLPRDCNHAAGHFLGECFAPHFVCQEHCVELSAAAAA